MRFINLKVWAWGFRLSAGNVSYSKSVISHHFVKLYYHIWFWQGFSSCYKGICVKNSRSNDQKPQNNLEYFSHISCNIELALFAWRIFRPPVKIYYSITLGWAGQMVPVLHGRGGLHEMFFYIDDISANSNLRSQRRKHWFIMYSWLGWLSWLSLGGLGEFVKLRWVGWVEGSWGELGELVELVELGWVGWICLVEVSWLSWVNLLSWGELVELGWVGWIC